MFDKNKKKKKIKIIAEVVGSTALLGGIAKRNYGCCRNRRKWGRKSKKDLFAEAFKRWIMTPEINRDLGWEKLDNFFRIDLPKIL